MLEYHIAGADKTRQNLKVQLPVTQAAYIPLLVKDYHDLPEITNQINIHIHPSFIVRRLLIVGLLPTLLILPLLWTFLNAYALFFIFYPVLIFTVAWRTQRNFCLWALEDACYIKKGVLGEERILIEWHKLQSIQIRQSIYQRRKNLASIDIQTAGGNIVVHFIPLAAAKQVVNFALYKTEAVNKSWL
jgi:putative membrane protein